MNKRLCYKIEILYNKYIPFIISFLLFIYHILRYYLPYDLMWVQYLCMPSLLTISHMFNVRFAFGLCKVHRCFVNYTIGNLVVCIIEHYWINPYMNLTLFIFIILGTLLALSLGIYYYVTEHEKLNSRSLKKVS